MNDNTESGKLEAGQIDAAILTSLKQKPCPIDEIKKLLEKRREVGNADELNEAILSVTESLAESGSFDEILSLYDMLLGWADMTRGGNMVADMWDACEKACVKDAMSKATYEAVMRDELKAGANAWRGSLAEVAADGSQVKVTGRVAKAVSRIRDAIRKYHVIRSFKEGAPCFNKTWGFGRIIEVDDFNKKFVIDFDKRAGHQISFVYAANDLRQVTEDHILAQRSKDRDAFLRKCKEAPDEVVRMAIADFGPMSVDRMDEVFAQYGLLPPGVTWNTFWTTARSRLKKDPMMSIPPATKKAEPVRILSVKVETGDDNWFDELKVNRKVTELMQLMAKLSPTMMKGASQEKRDIVANRLAFCFLAAKTDKNVPLMAKVAILANALKIEPMKLSFDEMRRELHSVTDVIKAATKLAPKDIAALILFIRFDVDDEVARPFIDYLGVNEYRLSRDMSEKDRPLPLPYSLVEAILPRLLNRDTLSADTKLQLQGIFAGRNVPPSLVLWFVKNQDNEGYQSLIAPGVLMTHCFSVLDGAEAGERLRLQHQIAQSFVKGEWSKNTNWLKKMLGRMREVEIQATYERVKDSDGYWEAPDRRAIIGHIENEFPYVKERREEPEAEEPVAMGRLTSIRSYNAYKQKFHDLVHVEMPKNAKDIEIARGYGDLRENFEYQTAKDAQRTLMARQEEMQNELKAVTATDFANFAAGRVAPGTAVTIAEPAGAERTFYILGEWDSEEALGIIPSGSLIAQGLSGKTVGDSAAIPDGNGGSRTVEVKAIGPLPKSILDWAAGL